MRAIICSHSPALKDRNDTGPTSPRTNRPSLCEVSSHPCSLSRIQALPTSLLPRRRNRLPAQRLSRSWRVSLRAGRRPDPEGIPLPGERCSAPVSAARPIFSSMCWSFETAWISVSAGTSRTTSVLESIRAHTSSGPTLVTVASYLMPIPSSTRMDSPRFFLCDFKRCRASPP